MSIAADQSVVFDHLLEPRTYEEWLVGAKDIREVDAHWPEPGARFHHRVGVGPLTIDDVTTVVSVSPPTELVLRASIGPLGTAIVRFGLVGSNPTVVRFDEAPDSGLLRLVGVTVGRAILRASVWGRNEASLEQLKHLVEGAPSTDRVPHEVRHRTGDEQARINRELDPPV
jgi:hypothetical protein